MAVYSDTEPVVVRPRGSGQGWAYLVLAIWLVISPWVLGFANVAVPSGAGAEFAGAPVNLLHSPGSSIAAASWNAWIIGGIVVVLSLLLVLRLRLWQDHVNLVLAAWLFAAPWVLGFNRWWPLASWDHWLTGLLIFLVAAWCLPQVRMAT